MITACGGDEVCNLDLIVGVAPADTTISVGGQITPRVTLLGCSGTRVLTDSLTWTSTQPAIAVVGTRTGIVIGASPGVATVTANGKTYGRIGAINVVVR